MKIKTSVIKAFLAFSLVFAAVTVAAAGTDYDKPPLFEGQEEKDAKIIKVCENEEYGLFADPVTLAIKVVEKAGNKTALQSDCLKEGDNSLKGHWRSRAKSAVTVYYATENTNATLEEAGADIKLDLRKDGFDAGIKLKETGISFTLSVTLEKNGIYAAIPASSIRESKTARYPLVAIDLFPFMNAVHGKQEGFILVPDGSGAVIDLNKPTLARNPYKTAVYGEDFGVRGIKDLTRYGDMPPLTVGNAVFGLSSKGEGYLACITSGQSHSTVNAYAAGIVTEYNFAYAGFVYRRTFYDPVDNRGTVIPTMQKERNVFDAGVHYEILKDATVGNMAKTYRQSLLSRGYLKTKKTEKPAPFKADFLMADNFNDSFGATNVVMTRPRDVKDAVLYLRENGIENMLFSLKGYSAGGLTGAQPAHFPVGTSGSKKEYRELNAFAKNSGAVILAAADYVRTYDGKLNKAGAAYKKRDLAMSLGKDILKMPDYEGGGSDMYLLHAKASYEYFLKDLEKLEDTGFSGIQFNSLGRLLNSSFGTAVLSRGDTMGIYGRMLEKAADGNLRTALYAPFEYMYKYTDCYAGAPLGGSGYMIAGKSVPFLEMALSGYMDMFTDYLNTGKTDSSILRMTEYNVYPSFIFTKESAYKLNRTASAWIFSSEFDSLKKDAVKIYKEVEEVLSKVRGLEYLSHEEREDGLTVCGYGGGVKIVINYGEEGKYFEGVYIEPSGCAVI